MSKPSNNQSEFGSHSKTNPVNLNPNFSNPSENSTVPTVFISDEEIDDSLDEWKFSLIGKLDLVKLKMKAAEASLRQQWKIQRKLQIIPLGKGFFIIKLDNLEDRNYIWKDLWIVESQHLNLRA